MLRGLLAWFIGVALLWNEDSFNFDQRFQMRGTKSYASEVVLIKLMPGELSSLSQVRTQRFTAISEIADVTDSLYWDEKTWILLLQQVLKQNPRKVGVLFNFTTNLGPLRSSGADRSVLFNPKVIWGNVRSNSEVERSSLFARTDLNNVGSLDVTKDSDLVVRRLSRAEEPIPHMIEKLTERRIGTVDKPLIINYRAAKDNYPTYSLTDLIQDTIPEAALKNKIILIGPDSGAGTSYLTPLGSVDRVSLFAELIDNASHGWWVKKLPMLLYCLLLFALMILCMIIMTEYPQTVAFVFLLWIAIAVTAGSFGVFDGFYYWIPILSPLAQIASTYVIFLGYQANKIERQHWILQQEQKYHRELEQLKNNFVSLISHDLKTPIAKIQGVLNRQLSMPHQDDLKSDLQSLKSFSDELHRYIQSILQLLRVESREFQIHREVGDINEVILSVIDGIKPLAAAKKIQIKTELEPMFSIEFDHILVREIILNLIENAIKYTPNEGIVTVKSHETDSEVLVEVIDNGAGIAKDEIPLIWGKFVRGKDQDLKTKGSGLGLYLVKYFVELHGGKVWVESEVNKGTTMAFSLPIGPTS